MALSRGIDGPEPVRGDPVGRGAGAEQERRTGRSGRLAGGTLACPACDAPVALARGPVSPADTLGCPFCDHASALRDFLSLATPTRPARVEVRVLAPAGTARRPPRRP